MSYILVLAILLCLPAAGFAGTVSGRVLDAESGRGVTRMTVRLKSAAHHWTAHETATNAQGAFTLQDVRPGRYRLVASSEDRRYAEAEYGAPKPGRPGVTLQIGGDDLAELEIPVVRGAVVTGGVRNHEGQPFARVQVTLLAESYRNGFRQFLPQGRAMTDDRGEYRVFGLAAGRYVAQASVMPVLRSGYPKDEAREEGYFTAYYAPGTTGAGDASVLDVGPGAELRGIDFQLRKERGVRVRGRVERQVQGPPIAVFLTPDEWAAHSGVNQTWVGPEGEFEFSRVAPGAYTLTARSVPAAVRRPLAVGYDDIEGIELVLDAGAEVRVAVRADPPGSVPLDGVGVALRTPRQADPALLLDACAPNLGADGAAQFPATPRDRYYVTVCGVPEGAYVASAAALAQPLDLTEGTAFGAEVVLRGGAGRVVGKVGDGVAAATVLLVPQFHSENRFRFLRAATADTNGEFAIDNLEPREYRAYAWADIEPFAWNQPGFLEPDPGVAVTVEPGSEARLELPVKED
ncbi:MAG: carboxypeptidase regulatory-like domain-containing protein [Bryobacterales bacterium]|nr:carboxypeptidase regulatory-like domain-containing protein [Bryobacterales bacterium]